MKDYCDILVAGAGASGLAAAITAARAGANTILLDARPAVGGTGGWSGLNTLCGLYDEHGEWLNHGFAQEFAQRLGGDAIAMGRTWVLPYDPNSFRAIAANLIDTTPRFRLCGQMPVEAARRQGGRVVSVNNIEVGAVIDCTGTAEVARALGLPCLATDATTQAPAVLFDLLGMKGDFYQPETVVRTLLPMTRAGWPPASFQPAGPGRVTVKFSGTPEQTPVLIEFLRSQVEEFSECYAATGQFKSEPRAGRMVMGDYLLTECDVLGAAKFPDAVARSAWPIEQWGPDGRARLRYLPAGEYYEIPARALRAAGLENFFMGGKSISADVAAIASARVMGCCLATGEAAAKLAMRAFSSVPAV